MDKIHVCIQFFQIHSYSHIHGKIKIHLFFQAVKTDESIKAEEIDGYRGGDDLDDLLKFIESKPGNTDSKGSKSSPSSTDTAQKSKRSRRTDRKSKRSRTPSVTGKVFFSVKLC